MTETTAETVDTEIDLSKPRPKKKPQDRKPKADAAYTFTAAGKKHTLPDLTEKQAEQIPGGITMDVMLDPDDEQAQVRLAFAALQVADVKPETLKALRSLPTGEMMRVVGEWMGESGGSSAS